MMGTIGLLAWRTLWDRPRRTLALLVGYGLGVAVVITLLSVGDALLTQARDRDLVAGGDLVLLPEGVDPNVLKVNGAADLTFTIQQAGFLVREVLRGARFAQAVADAAPQIDARQTYVRSRGRVFPAVASGGIPSLDRAAHATAAIRGARDTPADAAWITPAPGALIDRLDRFHTPPRGTEPVWAEWDYFNFVDPDSGTYGYLTVLAGGEGRGAILFRFRQPGRAAQDIAIRTESPRSPPLLGGQVINVGGATQRIGPARVRNVAGRYHVTVDDLRLHADLWLIPEAGFYLPPGEIAGAGVVSGYVVPVVRGWMSGAIRTARGEYRLTHALAYHDHNWGTWQGVRWEWGEASSDRGAVLYGGLSIARPTAPRGPREGSPSSSDARGTAPADSGPAGTRPPVLFLWERRPGGGAAPRGSFTGAFPVRAISYAGWHPGPALQGRRVSVPAAVVINATSGADRVSVHLRIADGLASLAPSGGAADVPAGALSRSTRRSPGAAFLQLRGIADVRGTVDGRPVAFTGPAAAETFVPLPPASPR